jgi:hypothetical protein
VVKYLCCVLWATVYATVCRRLGKVTTACSVKAGTSPGIHSQSIFKRELASRTSCIRLSLHTVRRILFCCIAKARFLGIGRGGSPTHACSVTTGSEVEGGGRISFWCQQSSPQEKEFLPTFVACGRMWFKCTIIWSISPRSCLLNRC